MEGGEWREREGRVADLVVVTLEEAAGAQGVEVVAQHVDGREDEADEGHLSGERGKGKRSGRGLACVCGLTAWQRLELWLWLWLWLRT